MIHIMNQLSNNSFWKGFYMISLVGGLFFAYLAVSIFRNTFIHQSVLILIVLIISLIAFFISNNHYKKIYNIKSNFFPLMQNFLSWGLFSCFLFLATNFYFADKSISDNTFKIISKSSLPGYRTFSKRIPTVRFNYRDFEKELVFYSSDTEIVDKAEKVNVQIRKGALGFDIMDKYLLVNTK